MPNNLLKSTEPILNYDLYTSPKPILRSPNPPGEGAEFYISLQIVVTPKDNIPVLVDKLQFIIPLGNTHNDISLGDDAASFSVNDSDNWLFIRLSPGIYQATPIGNKDSILIPKNGLEFRIYNLPVNSKVKEAKINITEKIHKSSNIMTNNTILKIKETSFSEDFYFENFRAQSPIIDKYAKATLTWIGSDDASYLLYSSVDPDHPVDVSKKRKWESGILSTDTIFILRASMVVGGETKIRDLSVMVLVRGAAPTDSIYTANGAILSDRSIEMHDKRLAFNGYRVNNFSIGASTFSVDTHNNRVGIGTATPTYTLDVNGDIHAKKIIFDNHGSFGTSSNSSFNLMTNNTPRLTISGDGNVGIGKNSSYITPPCPLSIYTDVAPHNSNSQANAYGFMHSDVAGNLQLTSYLKQYNEIWFGAYTRSTLVLTTNNEPRITIDSNGNVGIGTTYVRYPLEVNYDREGVIVHYENYYHVILQTALNKDFAEFGTTSYHDFHLRAGRAAITLQKEGNVGIGTTTPSCALDVNGEIRAKKIVFDSFEMNTNSLLGLFSSALKETMKNVPEKQQETKMKDMLKKLMENS
ncbi:hypothetical protein [Elizabethkingia anophelis]|uniref:hypothetical protein n=1 Tax=Elizabethkingia anophelis TaxID=1117645 RepID=UPI0038921CC3